jgi:hypothetical protein
VTPDPAARSAGAGSVVWWRRSFWICAVATLLLAASLAPHFRHSAELVRMRNALLLDAQPASAEWTPSRVPADFPVDRANLPEFVDVVAQSKLRVEGDDWATALAVAKHLLDGRKQAGVAIQADLHETYRRIRANGEGYCGDFADVYTGLLNAAGVFSRNWAFSFDGYGGRGHIFNEVWIRGADQWVLLDVFNNLYFVDAKGRPMSALAVRQALLDGQRPAIVGIEASASPGFRHPQRAYDYYGQGLHQWYLWWGNAVYAYDSNAFVKAASGMHRGVEQLAGVAAGVHPTIRVLDDETSRRKLDRLVALRLRLWAVVAFACLSLVTALAWWAASRRSAAARP